jgi:hypothetical protein
MVQPDTPGLSGVLAEAYQAAGSELSQDRELRQRVLERTANLPAPSAGRGGLGVSLTDEVAPIANRSVGKPGAAHVFFTESYSWLNRYLEVLDAIRLSEQLREWRKMNPW